MPGIVRGVEGQGGIQISAEPTTNRSSIPTRLTVAVVPIVAVVLVIGLYQAWSLFESAAFGESSTAIAVALAVAVMAVSVGTVVAARRIGRNMSSRIGVVSAAARRVANKDMAVVLDALRDPGSDLAPISPMDLGTGAGDEIGELAQSFQSLHGALIDVGARQMEAMKAGVASIFVTLARRNSSLVDRQLALLDELESREEDPQVLGGFYQLDHLATRMRRNAESLLVLAGSDSPRVWAKAADMSDVVRAAVSEVNEYQRIDLLALEPARLSAGAVSDVSHLLAELLENAVQFSPPDQVIRVTGLFDVSGYQISITDRGIGMSDARVAELNRILERPPALGLTVEPTLGMYVVAKLAARHGLGVELIRGVPGITARITIPRDRLETTKQSRRDDADPFPAPMPEPLPPVGEPIAAPPESVVDLTDPVYTEPSTADLPVRIPGVAFADDTDQTESVLPGEGASRIQSALAAYEVGRSQAKAHPTTAPSDDVTAEDDPR